jgi:hypothetical protein
LQCGAWVARGEKLDGHIVDSGEEGPRVVHRDDLAAVKQRDLVTQRGGMIERVNGYDDRQPAALPEPDERV